MHETIVNGLSKNCDRALYLLSGGLTVGGFVDLIDRHSWIVGAIIGLMTFITNCYFKKKQLEILARSQ